MLKESVTYIDYNENERTDELYFNLTDAEVMELELSTPGGLAGMINRVVAAQDQPTIIKIFKDLILKAYGVKSPDGKRFIKNDEVRAEFEQSEAYSILFMRLATDANYAAKFVNGIISAEKRQAIAQGVNGNAAKPVLTPVNE